MRKRASNVWIASLVAVELLLGLAGSATAQAPTPQPPAAALTGEDLGTWLDGFMPAILARGGIAGAVVVVVKDGAVLFEKGYGYADIATRTPVDPKSTLFRPGSISKLFTWTAVMQLVEAGKLDLDADVNQYLDFKIPPRGGKPITLRNCLTHTPGFEEFYRGYLIHTPTGRSVSQELQDWLPARVFDAGTTPAYSNYGAMLAGYIVERVSGEPFSAYIENHIYKPLGMAHSTFEQPLPERLAPFMSKGYPDASKPAKPFEYIAAPAAGGMSGSGDDMAQFMLAHLQDGRLGEAQILKPETARIMHTTGTALMAPLNGIELGFYDQNINGHRVIAHGGDLNYFHSDLALFLEDHVGLYISVNSAGVPGGLGPVREMLFENFADRYFPAADVQDGTVDEKSAAEHAKKVAGYYLSARGAYTNFMAAVGLLGQLQVTANPDGTISLSILNSPSGTPRKYREIAPFLWREVGGHDRVGAIVKDGRAIRVSSDLLSAIMVFDRAPASVSAAWIGRAALASLLVLLLTALAWPAAAIIRRRYRAPAPFTGERAQALRLARYGVLALLGAFAGWAWLAASTFGDSGAGEAPKNWSILLLEGLTLIATLGGTATATYNLVAVWKRPSGWFGKLWSVLMVTACVVMLWFAYQAHLMNFSTRY